MAGVGDASARGFCLLAFEEVISIDVATEKPPRVGEPQDGCRASRAAPPPSGLRLTSSHPRPCCPLSSTTRIVADARWIGTSPLP